jgi:hypothetical protein
MGNRVAGVASPVICGSQYRTEGSEELRPVGETELVAAVAKESESGRHGPLRACAGIVGHADCRLGERIDAVLEAHIEAGGGRFKGIRHSGIYDAPAKRFRTP